jgi:tetratricopeptide (TPR) repeat protein
LNKSRNLPAGINPTHTLNSFEYTLKEKPSDLSCHLQRIQFSISEKDNEALFAAVCDLFIVLGPLGLPLRQRLFSYCRKLLDPKQTEIINSHLAEKHLTNDYASLPDNCFFKKIQLELIESHDCSPSDTQKAENILDIAESYIENSQFDTALEYMQSCLEQNPEDKTLTIKLLALYRALNYADKFQSAYKKFSNNVATSLYWNDAKQYFLNQ